MTKQQDPFIRRFTDAIKQKDNPCIVGIDPCIARMDQPWVASRPTSADNDAYAQISSIFLAFAKQVIDAVSPLVPAVKFQSAYFEQYGAAGVRALELGIAHAVQRQVMVILDIKRGDIGSTSQAYADAYLTNDSHSPYQGVDAITLSPYLGADSLEPFVSTAAKNNKGLFVCVKTSNPGAAVLQEQCVGSEKVYEIVADMLQKLAAPYPKEQGYSHVGAVVAGGLDAATLKIMRQHLPDSIFLVPGYGAQAANLDSMPHYLRADGMGAVFSNSRAITYPHLFKGGHLSGEQAIAAATSQFIDATNKALSAR